MEELPRVSVIIPALNEEKYLPLLLESLVAVGEPMEVIVVDGNSTDKTVEVARSFEPRFVDASSLKVVTAPERGVARQRNLGAANASNDILLFLDADTIIPSAEYYRAFVSKFVESECVVASTLYRPAEPDWRASLIFAFCMSYQLCMFVFGRSYFAGFCTMTRKGVFEKVGGYDIRLRLAEDIDLSQRLSALGKSRFFFIAIATSARRLKKYGYLRTVSKWAAGGITYMLGGKHVIQKFSYPVGEFNE